jgi:cell division protein FtsB
MSRHHVAYAPKGIFTRRAIGPLLCVLVLFYLAFHTVSGDRGVFALLKASHQLVMLKAQLAEVSARRQALEARASLISNRSLDLDMLDERARIVLGYTGKDERVIFLNEE